MRNRDELATRWLRGGGIALVLLAFGWAPSVDAADRAAAAFAAGDFAEAAAEWRPRAEAGDAAAQFNLGLLYDTGRGVEPDTAQAAAWYRAAAEQGLAAAQYNLAVAYQRGRGVPYDLKEAAFWLEVAARADDPALSQIAADARDALSATIAPEDAAESAARAALWTPSPREAAPVTAEQDATVVPYLLLSEADTVLVQKRLRELGYDPGPADGLVGPRTRGAIRAFLEDRGIEPPPNHASSWLLRELSSKPE